MVVAIDWWLALERTDISDHSLGRCLKADTLGSLRKSIGRSTTVLWRQF
jgi:hypothetical protein